MLLRTNVSLLTFDNMETLTKVQKNGNGGSSRKEKIIEKAIQMYRDKGYTSSSVRDLAQKVGIEAPSIYSHFKSKEHILQHICFEMARAFLNGLECAELKSGPTEKLRAAIKEHIKVVLGRKEASAVMWNEWKFLTNPSYDEFQMMVRDYELRFTRMIQEGMKKGEFRKQDPKIVSNLILASLNSLSHWYKGNDTSLEELENEFSEIYLKGILTE